MNILIAGAFGHLGKQITETALEQGHRVTGLDLRLQQLPNRNFDGHSVDLTDPEQVRGFCDGIDTVITTVGLTSASKKLTHYDIDYRGNLNLLQEARRAGVNKFIYISVIHADSDASIPMLDAKHQFERKLKASGMDYTIYRPTGYFYDIAKVFYPMIEAGTVTLLKTSGVTANVISTDDFAAHILRNLDTTLNETLEIGGQESYSYEEIAELFFEAAGKPIQIKYAPPFLFDLLALIAKLRRTGKEANIRFGKWTLTHSMEAANKIGEDSFSEYITDLYR